MTCITFGFKPDKEKAPEWATHMIMVENQPEIWYFAHKKDGAYFVYDEDDHEMKVVHIMYTDHSVVMGGVFELV